MFVIMFPMTGLNNMTFSNKTSAAIIRYTSSLAMGLPLLLILAGCQSAAHCDDFLNRVLVDVHDDAVVRDARGDVVELTIIDTTLSDAEKKCIRSYTKIHTLRLDDTNINDGDLAWIAEMDELQALDLDGTQVSDKGMRTLASRKCLVALSLSGTSVTDDGLQALADCRRLMLLNIDWTDVSDEGLLHLSEISTLKLINALGTSITEDGVEQLQAHVPDVYVNLSPRELSKQKSKAK